MQRWEYLVVETRSFGFSLTSFTAYKVNGRELGDWKKTPLHVFLTQLGTDGWEMTGIVSFASGTYSTTPHHMFFKRPRPDVLRSHAPKAHHPG